MKYVTQVRPPLSLIAPPPPPRPGLNTETISLNIGSAHQPIFCNSINRIFFREVLSYERILSSNHKFLYSPTEQYYHYSIQLYYPLCFVFFLPYFLCSFNFFNFLTTFISSLYLFHSIVLIISYIWFYFCDYFAFFVCLFVFHCFILCLTQWVYKTELRNPYLFFLTQWHWVYVTELNYPYLFFH